jgi:exosortase A
MSSQAVLDTKPIGAFRELRSVAPALVLGLLLLGVLFQQDVSAAVGIWSDSTAYNHCFLIIPIVAYLIWDRRATLVGVPAKPVPWVALAAIPVGIAWLVAERLGVMEGRQLMVVTLAELLLLAVLGWRLWFLLLGPLLYLYFLVPFGAFVTPLLQDFTTSFVVHGLALLNIPNFTDGRTIEIPEGVFLVAEACAGLRFLIASTAFGCLYALLMYRGTLRRTVFILVSIIVPIIANGFRALGIVVLGHVLGSAQAAVTDHILYGWMFFSIVILLLVVLGLPFRQDHRRYEVSSVAVTASGDGGHGRASFAAAALVVAVAAVAPLIVFQLDRANAAGLTGALPPLAVPAGCSAEADGDAPVGTLPVDGPVGRLLMQRIACDGVTFDVRVQVFSPHVTPGRILSEQRRLTGEGIAEDTELHWLSGSDGGPPIWRLSLTSGPSFVAATGLWIDGGPTPGGFAMRIRQAWNSVVGSPFAPLVVAVSPEADWSRISQPRQAELVRRLTRFLQDQPGLVAQLGQLSAAAAH